MALAFIPFLGGAVRMRWRGGAKGRHGLGALWVGLQAEHRVPIGAGGGEPHLAPSYWSEVGARPGRGPAADCGREGGCAGRAVLCCAVLSHRAGCPAASSASQP